MSKEDNSSKKRARSEEKGDEELEIDVDAAEPLSKRAARKLKKGKSLKKAPDPAQTTHESESEDEKTEYKKGTNGIWIGNITFKTTEADLTSFFTETKPLGKSKRSSEYEAISPADVVRISLPASEKKGQNKGFAYIDFSTPGKQETAIALSERILLGRNVLIKAADSFDGRPAPKKEELDDKATKILYIGNLSFDITSDELSQYLGSKEAGIKKVRMATFEDSGKCKGFAFIDFTTIEQVTSILKNRKLHTMNGRKLKMEYGEDRSLRRKPRQEVEYKEDARRRTPGSALANAQRASMGIIEPSGTKITF